MQVGKRWRRSLIAVTVAVLGSAVASTVEALTYPGNPPGRAEARIEGHRLVFENEVLRVVWRLESGRLGLYEIVDKAAEMSIDAVPDESFALALGDGTIHSAASFVATDEIRLQRIPPNPAALRAADRRGGWRASASLRLQEGDLALDWAAELRDDANYVRCEWTLRGEEGVRDAAELTVLRVAAPGGQEAGSVDGSPVVLGNVFLGCEHPTANNGIRDGAVVCSAKVPRYPSGAGPASFSRSCVFGVSPVGQLRRAFAYYLERQRPRPYAPFLHYNSWYDISWAGKAMDERECLEAIEVFERNLVAQRGVRLHGFLLDDGWDDPRTLWGFHEGFPRGFTAVRAAAEKAGGAVGVWLSPWGGYGEWKERRLQYGRAQGFETNRNGFSLAGPKYYARFRDVCLEMMDRYGVNAFKFDGLSQGLSSRGAGDEFAADVDALLRLAGDLREHRADVFINATTGTWPSPFWLLYVDSIWRDGNDMGFHGTGSRRQQWITYRDMIVYRQVVGRAPLYPLNSLMTQGIVHARYGTAAGLSDNLAEWKSEVRSFFASGTQLQELYVRPQSLTPEMWDVLAEGARWSAKNADILADVHWIGGDPGAGEAYGFAAWQPRGGMLALRNPTSEARSVEIDVAQAFELPPGVPVVYRLVSPWQDWEGSPIVVEAGKPRRFELAPFEVAVYDAVPAP
ncbi:alpha-galactosidase [Thermopirellula anaerolimosa]